MSFDDIWGQEPAVQTLTRALEHGRVHHAYRFEGPGGVGKEKTALRLAQALVCELGGVGCGTCSGCRRAVTFSEEEPRVPVHPDVVFVGRGLYRSVTGQAEASAIGVDQVRRVVLGRVGFPPHEGRALVFIVRDADELSPPAANSLLKTLEEPPARTHFILLTSRPNRLLDTIRSRTLPVRFPPLADGVVARILEARGLPVDVLPLAQGSAEQALSLAADEGVKERKEFAEALASAVDAPDFSAAVRFSESRKADRETLRAQLSFYAQQLAAEAREGVRTNPHESERRAQRHQLVLVAMDDLERNVQPALALEAMLVKLRAV